MYAFPYLCSPLFFFLFFFPLKRHSYSKYLKRRHWYSFNPVFCDKPVFTGIFYWDSIFYGNFRYRNPFFGSTQFQWSSVDRELCLLKVSVAADYSDSVPDSSNYTSHQGYHPLEEVKISKRTRETQLTSAEIARTTVEVGAWIVLWKHRIKISVS